MILHNYLHVDETMLAVEPTYNHTECYLPD